jgi:uncharacterized protein YggE
MNDQFFAFARPIRVAMITMVSFLALFLALASVNEIKSWNAPIDPTKAAEISVSGKGEVTAKPDIATFSFTIDEQATTAKAAQDQATNLTNKAVDYLKQQGIEDKDIQTQGYNSNPRYEYQQSVCPMSANSGGVAIPCRPSKQVLTGYEVTQTIQVKVRNTDKAGEILAGLTNVGIKNIGGLSLTVDKPETLVAQARQKAIDDAKAKADLLARQLGVRLVRITDFQEQGNQPIYYAEMSKGVASDVAATPAPAIPTGENNFTSNVTITYEIR